VLATMNPLDHQGTYALPQAQLDRFMVMLDLGALSAQDEVRVLDRHLLPEPALSQVSKVIGREDFLVWQETVPLVHVAPELKQKVVEHANQLRAELPHAGALSPRATLQWVRMAQ